MTAASAASPASVPPFVTIAPAANATGAPVAENKPAPVVAVQKPAPVIVENAPPRQILIPPAAAPPTEVAKPAAPAEAAKPAPAAPVEAAKPAPSLLSATPALETPVAVAPTPAAPGPVTTPTAPSVPTPAAIAPVTREPGPASGKSAAGDEVWNNILRTTVNPTVIGKRPVPANPLLRTDVVGSQLYHQGCLRDETEIKDINPRRSVCEKRLKTNLGYALNQYVTEQLEKLNASARQPLRDEQKKWEQQRDAKCDPDAANGGPTRERLAAQCWYSATIGRFTWAQNITKNQK